MAKKAKSNKSKKILVKGKKSAKKKVDANKMINRMIKDQISTESLGTIANRAINRNLDSITGNIKDASSFIGKIFGFGDYTINSNSLVTDSVPQFTSGNRTTRIRHREYIQDVVSGAANSFSIQSININPGNSLMFPWLSQVASNYEEYIIKGMIFEFKSMSADALNSTNTALGQVIMATQYNVNSPPFTSKQQMENYEFGVSVKPSQSVIHPIECAPGEAPLRELFILTNDMILPSNQDARLYDYGKFNIAVNGMQAANVNVGELWVSYDIVLLKPKLSQTWGSSHYSLTKPPSVANYFNGPDAQASPGSNLNLKVSNNIITFPPSFNGYAKIDYAVYGTGFGNVTLPTITTSAGVTPYNVTATGGNIITNAVGANDSDKLLITLFYHIVNGGQVAFFLGSGTMPPAPASGDLYVEAINY